MGNKCHHGWVLRRDVISLSVESRKKIRFYFLISASKFFGNKVEKTFLYLEIHFIITSSVLFANEKLLMYKRKYDLVTVLN